MRSYKTWVVPGFEPCAMQEVEINTSIDIFKYNKLNAYTLRPSLTYFPFRPKKFGMDIHCSLVLYQRYSGALLSDNFKLIKSGPLLDQRRLSTINPGIGFSYPIMYGTLKSKLFIRYQYSQLATSQERHMYGLGLSFSL